MCKGRLTYLHTAFLYLFHEFGYEWALNPYTAKIREQLLNPDQNILEVLLVTLQKGMFLSEFQTPFRFDHKLSKRKTMVFGSC
jgi:hypothetical protein